MEFIVKTTLPASAKSIYNAWLSSDAHTNMTGGEAIVSANVGETFTAWDGYIDGINLILEPHHRIVQGWRTAEFDNDEADSEIEILLVEKDEETELTLHHRGLPESGEHYRKGWQDSYFTPMLAYFSAL